MERSSAKITTDSEELLDRTHTLCGNCSRWTKKGRRRLDRYRSDTQEWIWRRRKEEVPSLVQYLANSWFIILLTRFPEHTHKIWWISPSNELINCIAHLATQFIICFGILLKCMQLIAIYMVPSRQRRMEEMGIMSIHGIGTVSLVGMARNVCSAVYRYSIRHRKVIRKRFCEGFLI